MGLPEEPFLICLFFNTVLLTGYPVCQLLYKGHPHRSRICRRYAIRQLLETAVFRVLFLAFWMPVPYFVQR
jgi:hypothetical protein